MNLPNKLDAHEQKTFNHFSSIIFEFYMISNYNK